MNITPYLIALVGIVLLIQQEYAIAGVLLIIAGAQIVFPNLNTMTGTPATILRFGLIGTIVSLLIYQFFYVRG